MTPARSLMPQMVRQQMESYVRQLTPVQRNWATTVARKLAAVKGPISLSQLRAGGERRLTAPPVFAGGGGGRDRRSRTFSRAMSPPAAAPRPGPP